MTPLHIKTEDMADGSCLTTQWGYCRQQNAVRLGYAISILAALVGLLLLAQGFRAGLWVCLCVGAGYGCTYFAEQMRVGRALLVVAWAGVAFTLAAYLVILMCALVL